MVKQRGRPPQQYSYAELRDGSGRDAIIARAWNEAYAAARVADISEKAARGRATRDVAAAHRLSLRQVQTIKGRFTAAQAALREHERRITRMPGTATLMELRSSIATLQLDKFVDGNLRTQLRITRRLLSGVKALDRLAELEAENRKLRTQLVAEQAWRSPGSAGSTKRK